MFVLKPHCCPPRGWVDIFRTCVAESQQVRISTSSTMSSQVDGRLPAVVLRSFKINVPALLFFLMACLLASPVTGSFPTSHPVKRCMYGMSFTVTWCVSTLHRGRLYNSVVSTVSVHGLVNSFAVWCSTVTQWTTLKLISDTRNRHCGRFLDVSDRVQYHFQRIAISSARKTCTLRYKRGGSTVHTMAGHSRCIVSC